MNRRRPAFDPSRLDDLDDLLPIPEPTPQTPVQQAPTPTAPAPRVDQGSVTEAPRPAAVAPQAPAPAPRSQPTQAPAPRQPRGHGGRPVTRRGPTPTRVRDESSATGRVPVAVRIPRLLYEDVNNDLLSGPERPSYGQLVVWTCEDHPDTVASTVRAARPQPGSRRPRGRRLAADTVQVTLRLTVEERDLLDGIINDVKAGGPGGVVTRTEVATAALRLALEAAPSE